MRKIGIIKEGKVPVDRRVPFTPEQVKELKEKFDVEVKCQSSNIRCFSDEEYNKQGVLVNGSVEDCDILMGVKEVPLESLMENKTYFFFSHTIKKQAYNRELLHKVLEKNIQLIDYETLTSKNGTRIVAFGRYAGIVGAYNGILTFGKRYNLFDLRPAHQCFDLEDLKTEFNKVKLPPIKIVLTGGGRVSKGSMEVLFGMGIKRVSPIEFLEKEYNEPVFTQLNSRDYNKRSDDKGFERTHFYSHPELYESDFLKFSSVADVLIAGAFWNPQSPVLFKVEDMVEPGFKIKVIADITCDIEGSIPSTVRPSTIDAPVYDFNPTERVEEPAFKEEGNITVMAVDNLPCELPRNASEDFGRELIDNVIPALLLEDPDAIIDRASITTADGKLNSHYTYLQEYVEGKE